MDEFDGVSGLKSADVVKIIKACSDYGVKEFSFGSLEFKLGARDNESSAFEQAVNIANTVHEYKEVHPEMEDELNEQRLEELMITDPLAHEELVRKLLAGGELE